MAMIFSRLSPRFIKWFCAGTVLFLLCLSLCQVFSLRLEKDEGYLTASSWLIANGKLPYLDFVFPQQPYFPLIYSNLFRVTGPSLVAARVTSWLFFIALSALVAAYTARRYGKLTTFFVWLLFFSNTLSLYWYPRAKHYVIADFLLFSSFFIVTGVRKNWSTLRPYAYLLLCALAGFCAGGAIQTRLLLAPAILLLAWLTFWPPPGSWQRLICFSGGFLVSNIPFLWLLASAPDKWFFQCFNLQFFLRPPFQIWDMIRGATVALGDFLSFPVPLLLVLLTLSGLLIPKVRHGTALTDKAPWAMLAILGVILLSCHPTQRQYLIQLLPYLVLLIAAPVDMACNQLSRRYNGQTKSLLCMAAIILVVLLGGHRAAGRVYYSHYHHPIWGLSSFSEYQKWMNTSDRASRGITLTWWPGYLLVRGVKPYPGAELGRPADRGVERMTEEDFIAAGLRHPRHILRDIDDGLPYWVVTGMNAPEGLGKHLEKHYHLAARFNDIYVYEKQLTAVPPNSAGPE